MIQRKKMRPTRAERARQKTRTPNLPEFTGPDDWDRPAPPPPPVAPPAAPGGNFAAMAGRPQNTPFARAARSTSMEVTQDYSYLRQDLVRIGVTSVILLALMLGFAAWYNLG